MKEYKMGLCAGRHIIPGIDSYIFPENVNPIDEAALYDMAWDAIPSDAENLIVYATGLTVAMLAVVKVCERRGITLTVMHYDRVSENYFKQRVLAFCTCGFCGGRYPAHAYYCTHCGAT